MYVDCSQGKKVVTDSWISGGHILVKQTALLTWLWVQYGLECGDGLACLSKIKA